MDQNTPVSQLSEAEAWFFEIFNSKNEAIFIQNIQGKILEVNNYAVTLYGFESKNELIGLYINDISADQSEFSLENAKQKWTKAIHEASQCFDWLAKKKNGECFWVEVTLRHLNIMGQEKILATVHDISHRKETEQALIESEKYLKDTQNITNLGIYKMNLSTGMWECSEILDRIFGIETNFTKDVQGWAELLHPDWREYMTQYFAEYVVRDKNKFDKEYQIVRPNDKTQRWVHGLGELVFDNNGTPVQMIGSIRDITERKTSEAAIEKAIAEQNAMLANIADVVAIIDINGINRYKSPNIEKWFGWKPEELIGKNTWDNVHPDDVPASMQVFNNIANGTSNLLKSECRYLCKDGSYKWIEYTASNHLNNKFINGILLNYHDISENKQAKIDLGNEQHFSKAILDSLPGIFYMYSYPELKLKQWNKNHETLLGFTAEEMYNRSIFDWHAPDAREAVKQAVDYVMQAGQNAIEGNLLAKNGNYIPFLMTGVKFEINGQLYLIGNGINITMQKENEKMIREKTEQIESQNEEYQQLNEELLQTNDELLAAKKRAEESDRLKTAFLQNMSHEIRTPMNAIMGFSDLMVDAYGDKPKLEYYSSIISRRCNDLLAIINDILDISKIESGQVNIILEKCIVSSLFSELRAFFGEYRKKLKKEHLSFELVINPELEQAVFLTDIVKLKQILINLIGNAFKFTNEGKVSCSCHLVDANKIVFCIADTGVGIPKEKHQFIFERFAQAHHDKKAVYGGTGLGLSIVKGLTDLLKGHIWVESEPNIGSKFYISLPFELISNKPQIFTESKTTKNRMFCGKTVLIVEDEPFNTIYLEEIFEGCELTILTAENGTNAIEIAKSQTIDIVLMDIRLPDMSGYNAIKEIKKVKPELKIIAQTAYAAPEDKQRALNSGCIDYISKPIKRELMLSLMAQHLL